MAILARLGGRTGGRSSLGGGQAGRPGIQRVPFGRVNPLRQPHGFGIGRALNTPPPVPGASEEINPGPVRRPGSKAMLHAMTGGGGALGATGPGGAAAQPPSPFYDATALANIAQNMFNTNQKIAGLNAQISNAGINYQNQVGQLNYQQPRDQLAMMQGANSRGGLFSSVENQNQGNLVNKYDTARSADLQNFGNTWGSDLAQIADLQGGIRLYNQGQSANAVNRYVAMFGKFPGAGESGNLGGGGGSQAPATAGNHGGGHQGAGGNHGGGGHQGGSEHAGHFGSGISGQRQNPGRVPGASQKFQNNPGRPSRAALLKALGRHR